MSEDRLSATTESIARAVTKHASTVKYGVEVARRMAANSLQLVMPILQFPSPAGRFVNPGLLASQLVEDEYFAELDPAAHAATIAEWGEPSDRHVAANALCEELSMILEPICSAYIEGRGKSTFGLWHKQQRYALARGEIFDLVGARVMVAKQVNAAAVADSLYTHFAVLPAQRFQHMDNVHQPDRIVENPVTGYKARHINLQLPAAGVAEVQIMLAADYLRMADSLTLFNDPFVLHKIQGGEQLFEID